MSAANPPGRSSYALVGGGLPMVLCWLVGLAASASLALAVGAWLRPKLVPLLGLVAIGMLAFAALDVREVFHQADMTA